MKKLILILIIVINISGYAIEKIESLNFKENPYINPRIIEDMSTWFSDTGDQVVAINLDDSQNSNRYFCDYEIAEVEGEFPYVGYKREDGGGGFGYQYIGELEPNTHVIKTYDNGGGSFTSVELMFIKILKDDSITYDIENHKIEEKAKRTLLYKVGSVFVAGQRYRSFYMKNGQIFESE